MFKMNKIIRISFFALAIFLLNDASAFAQRRPSKKEKTDEPANTEDSTTRPTRRTTKTTDKYFDESGGFKHRLWYGGGFTLGLNSNNYGSSFAVGVTPMIGYKIVGDLSAGPRFGVVYNSQGFGNVRVSWTDYSLGAFARYKFLGFLFLHAEYGYSSKAIGLDNSGSAIKANRFSPALGGGYNSGNGVFGYEIALLYDPTLANNAFISPLDIRAGFTYNF